MTIKRSDLVCHSAGFISGLILTCFGRYLAFDSKDEAYIARFSLKMIGHGFFECSLNLPSLKKSRIDNEFTLFSPSETMDFILSKS